MTRCGGAVSSISRAVRKSVAPAACTEPDLVRTSSLWKSGSAEPTVTTAGLSFQPQLWYYTATVDDVTFDAIATPPDILYRLSGADWITAWFDLLDEELALADAPDEEFTVPQKNYADGTSTTGGGTSPGGFEPGPKGPGGPGKRPKPKTPRRPPGPPG